MILVVGGIKGGTGKTTLATNLTVLRSATGKKVLLVDADEQRSASDWIDHREDAGIKSTWTTIQLAGKTVHSTLNKLKHDYDDIIIDVGGRDTTSQRSSLMVADKLLIPFKPRSLDIWTIGKVFNMMSDVSIINPNLKAVVVINQADPQGKDNQDALLAVGYAYELKCVPTFIGNRKSFANAATHGLGISELKVLDKRSNAEMQCLYNFLYEEYDSSMKLISH